MQVILVDITFNTGKVIQSRPLGPEIVPRSKCSWPQPSPPLLPRTGDPILGGEYVNLALKRAKIFRKNPIYSTVECPRYSRKADVTVMEKWVTRNPTYAGPLDWVEVTFVSVCSRPSSRTKQTISTRVLVSSDLLWLYLKCLSKTMGEKMQMIVTTDGERDKFKR